MNFIGDDIAVREFVCVDLAQSDIEQLWSQLPEVVEEELVIGQVPAAVPVLPHSLSLLCMNASSAAPVLNQVQGLPMTEGGEQELVVYTDGSVKGLGSAECCGGAGVVVLDGDRSMGEVAVRLGGWMSSTKAEVYACITALAALPVSQPVHIHTDSQGLIAGYRSFVAGASEQSPHQLLQNQFWREWSVFCQTVSCCTASITLTKVSTYTVNLGNDIADQIAKQGASRIEVWVPSIHALTDARFHPAHSSYGPVEEDL